MAPQDGILTLEAISGHKLKKLERFLSSQDPYVIFTNPENEASERTETHTNSSAEPRWNEKGLKSKVQLAYNPNSNSPILVQVFNDNGKSTHKLIGEAQLNVADLVRQPGSSISLPDLQLKNKGNNAGTLKLNGLFEVSSTSKQSTKSVASKEELKIAAAQVAQDKKKIQEHLNSGRSTNRSNTKDESNDGKVLITVKRASNLKNLKTIFQQSPFVTIKNLETGEQHTTAASSGVNPEWKDARLEFLHNPRKEGTNLSVQVSIKKDRHIGTVSIPMQQFDLQSIAPSSPAQLELELKDSEGNTAGTLYLDVAFKPKKKRSKHNSEAESATEKLGDREFVNNDENKVAQDKAKNVSKRGKLTFTVLSGTKLRNVQRIGSQDPFVVATLLPWETQQFKTKQSDGVNPVWDNKKNNTMVFDYHGQLAESQVPELQIEVFDAETIRNRIIGTAKFVVTEYIKPTSGPVEVHIELVGKDHKPAGVLNCNIQFHEENTTETTEGDEAAQFPTTSEVWDTKGMLIVVAKSAKLTRDVELLGKQDPFMKVTLLPWASLNQQGQTKSKKNAGKIVSWSEGDDNVLDLYYPGKSGSGEVPRLLVEILDHENSLTRKVVGERIIGSGEVQIGAVLNHAKQQQERGPTNPMQFEVPLRYEHKSSQFKSAGSCIITLSFDSSRGDPGRNIEAVQKSKKAPIPRLSKKGAEEVPRKLPADILLTFTSGKDLKDTAWTGKQDPYVKVTLFPWNTEYRTKCVDDGGTQVEWTEEHNNHLQLKYPGAAEDVTPYIKVQVLDEQVGGDRLIGECILESSVFLLTNQRGVEHLEIPLQNNGKQAGIVFGSVACNVRKGILGTRCGTLVATIVGTSMNKGGDWIGKSDPYVVIHRKPGVKPTSPDQQFKTNVMSEAGLATEFEQIFNVPMFDYGLAGVGSEGTPQQLGFTVMDKDTFTADDKLGEGWKELDEVMESGPDYDSTYTHEVSLMDGKYTRGFVYTKLRFQPSKWRGTEIREVLAAKTGSLRVWALEARELKSVGGMLDRKQDPYLAVYHQVRKGQGVPEPHKWPKEYRTPVAVDAGSECVWNAAISIPHTPSDVAFAASTGSAGFLHLAAFDQGMIKDTIIGTKVVNIDELLAQLDQQEARKNDTAYRDDVWITIVDGSNSKAGQVRIAIEFTPDPPQSLAKQAKKDMLGFVDSGSVHLFIRGIQGLPSSTVEAVEVTCKFVQGSRFEPHNENRSAVAHLGSVPNQSGSAVWDEHVELSYIAPDINPDNEKLLPVPSICVEVTGIYKGKLAGLFGDSKKVIGKANIPLCSLVEDLTNVSKDINTNRAIPVVLNNTETHASVVLQGVFVPNEMKQEYTAIVASLGSNRETMKSTVPGILLPKSACRRTSGRIHFKVLEGKLARDHDLVGKQDPFVQGELLPGGSKFRTATCQEAGKFPVWTDVMENQHELLVTDAASSIVSLGCYDEDQTAHDFIGSVEIPVSQIVKLSSKSGEECKVKLVEPWETLVESEEGFHNDQEKRKAFDASKTVFASQAWNTWIAKLYHNCIKQSTSDNVERPTRKELLIQFYSTYAKFKDDKEKIEKKVAEIDHKYLDAEHTNKSLFVKLYKIHAPHETCPVSMWEKGMDHALGALTKDGKVHLTREEFPHLIDYIEPRVDSALQLREGTLKLSDARTKAVEGHFDELFPKHEDPNWNQLTLTRFEECAKVVVSQLIIIGIEEGTYMQGQYDLGTVEKEEGNKNTMLWTLVDKKGNDQGTLLVKTWFTDDWKPPSDELNPNLLQPGVLVFQVTTASLTSDKDLFGKQDPYLELSWMLGDGIVPQGFKPLRTKPKSNAGTTVEWTETEGTFELEYQPNFAITALQTGATPVFSVRIKDKDFLSSDMIGETRIPILPMMCNPNQLFSRELPLVGLTSSSGGLERNGTLSCKFKFVPSIPNAQVEVVPPATKLSEIEGSEETECIPGQLIVKIASARHLKDVQWIGKMDPQAVLRLWPFIETATTNKAIDQESDPTWNETYTLEVEDAPLSLFQLDVIANGEKSIGSCQIPLYDLIQSLLSSTDDSNKQETVTSIENWFQLTSANQPGKSSGEVCLSISFMKHSPPGSISRSMLSEPVHFVQGPGKLHFNIQHAFDLHDVAKTGKQDPYVTLTSIGWRKSFEKTSPCDENGGRNPIFNFACAGELEWSPRDKVVPCLKLVVRDKGTLRDAEIASVQFSVVPWLLAPGQISVMWLPLYEEHKLGQSFGPYKHVPKQGMMLIQMQYIPDADYPGKPAVAMDKAMIDHISHPIVSPDNNTDVTAAPEVTDNDGETSTDIKVLKPREGDIHVKVIGARNLKDVQTFGVQDPYVRLALVACPGVNVDPVFVSGRTEAVENGGSNPKWGSDLILPYSESELGSKVPNGCEQSSATPILICELWDANNMRDERIGKALLPMFPYILDGRQVFDTWVPIVNSGGVAMGEVHLAIQVRNADDKLQTARSSLPENVLNVIAVRARNLYNAGDITGRQDPQVHVEFVGNDHVVKSTIATNSGTEPYWGERLSIPGCEPDARGILPRLRVTVVDVDSGSSDDFIGRFEFSLTKKLMGDLERGKSPEPLEKWFTLTDLSGKTERGELNLILRRGPFPEDEPPTLESECKAGRLFVDVLKGTGVVDKDGKTISKPFIRVSAWDKPPNDGETKVKPLVVRDSQEAKKCGSDPVWNTCCVFPFQIDKYENKEPIPRICSLDLSLCERRWTLLGKKPKTISMFQGVEVQNLLRDVSPGQVVSVNDLKLVASGSTTTGAGSINVALRYVPFLLGQLRVKVIGVSGVTSMEMFSKNDLRVEVRVDNGTPDGSQIGIPQKTATMNGAGSEAEFNETMHFAYSNSNETILPCLEVKVVDVDTLSNDLCGTCYIPLTFTLLQAFLKEQSIENGNEQGNVYDNNYGGVKEYLLLPQSSRPSGTIEELQKLNQTLPEGLASAGKIRLDISFLPDSSTFQKPKVEKVEEEVSEMRAIWKQLDVNKDSRLTLSEFLQGVCNNATISEFLSLAVGSDGAAEETEARNFFEEMNVDNNDSVSFEEFSQFVSEIPARQQAKQERLKRLRESQERDEDEKQQAADIETSATLDAEAERKRREKEAREKATLAAEAREREKQRLKEQSIAEERRNAREAELAEQRRLDEEAKRRREEEEDQLLDRIRRKRESEMAAMALRRAKEEAAWNAREAARRAEQIQQAGEDRRSRKPERVRPGNVFLWRTRDVVEWLDTDLDLPQYVAAFAEGAVDGALLVQLTDSELENHLGVVLPLHRRKIQLRAKRLLTMATGSREVANNTNIRESMDSSLANARAAEAGKSQLARAQLVQKIKSTAEERRNRAIREANRDRINKFEYNDLESENAESSSPLDWYDPEANDILDHHSQLVQSPTTGASPSLSRYDYDDRREEEDSKAFRDAMRQVHESITFAIEDDLRRSTNMVKLPALSSPQPNSHHDLGSPDARTPSSRPRLDLGPVRRVPIEATDNEVLEITRRAVFALGAQLFGWGNSKEALKQALSLKPADQENLLRIVYKRLNRLKNNRHESAAKLSRLKLQGALKIVLRLDMNWSQFDRLFRLFSPQGSDGTNSTIELQEFVDALKDLRPTPPLFRSRPNSTSSARSNHPQHSGPQSPQQRRQQESSELAQIGNTLFKVCEILMESKLDLKNAFAAFDRNGSGYISVAEFASLMRVLAGNELSKKQIYYLMNCVDTKFDRKVHFDEFMNFWLIAYAQWLENLERQGVLESNSSLRRLASKVDQSLRRTFGSSYQTIVQLKLDEGIMDPYASLLRATEQSVVTATGESPLQRRRMKQSDEPTTWKNQARRGIENLVGASSHDDTPLSPPELRGLASDSIARLLNEHHVEENPRVEVDDQRSRVIREMISDTKLGRSPAYLQSAGRKKVTNRSRPKHAASSSYKNQSIRAALDYERKLHNSNNAGSRRIPTNVVRLDHDAELLKESL